MRVFAGVAALFLSVGPSSAAGGTPPGIPLAIDAHGGITLDVQVNGHGPYRFLLDTGSARSIVGESVAREVAAPVVARTEVVNSAWSEMRLVVRLSSLAVAASHVDNLLAPVLPDARLLEAGPQVRGVLGQDFLSAFNYTLDYRRRTLRWDEAVACEGPNAVPLRASDGRFVATVAGDRGAPLRLVPDSGAEVPVLFTTKQPDAAAAAFPRLQLGAVKTPATQAMVVERQDPDADGLLPLHHFSAVSFAEAGACLVAR